MGLLPCSSQHTAAQHQETLRHCHESGPRNVLHLIPALDCPQCPLVEWSRSRPGANVGVNAMPRTPQHTSCCGAVDELGAAAPQHHSTTLITVFCLQGQVRRWRWWRVRQQRRRTGFLGSVTGPSLHQHQQQDAAAA